VSTLLEVEGLAKTYALDDGREVVALRDVSFAVEAGEFIAIVGPSGCGKTTLLEMLAGLRTPTSGRVVLNGSVVTKPRSSIGVVFQEESTFPWRTVIDNVAFGLEMRGESRESRYRKARAMLELVGLADFERARPAQLSGGMKQRVALARTLLLEPELVVMDEPFSALDEQTRLLLGVELLAAARATGATVALVTHSIQEAALLSDRVLMLSARPGTIRAIVESRLPKPRDAGAIASAAFGEMTRHIWLTLHGDELGTHASFAGAAP
jgi:NitT/TauT family transport system ATP-binding protein